MTFKQNPERRLPALLGELSDGPMPDYRDDILRRVARTRQRPAWTFPERWIPMTVLSRRPAVLLRAPWRLLGLAALTILILVAVAAFYVGSQHRLPAPFGPAVNGQLAYQSGNDILVRDFIDGPDRVLIGGPDVDGAPIWSRQGDRLLFVRDLETSSATLMIASPSGSGAHPISGPIAGLTALAWSPTGTMIAASSEADGRPIVTIYRADGSGSKKLDLGIPATFAFWRPGTTDELLFRGEDPDGPGLYLVRSDGSGLQRLGIAGGGILDGQYDFLDPAWSTNGLRIAFHQLDPVAAAPDGNGFRIHVVDVDAAGKASNARALEFDPEADDELQAHWTPLDDAIVFQRRVGSTDTLHLGTPAGKLVRDLGGRSLGGGGFTFELSPNGESVFVLYMAERTLWQIQLNTGVTSRVETTGLLEFPSWQRTAP